MLKILGRVTSINVRKVPWVADRLGLAYEREDWGLPLRDPDDPTFLALNPNGLVPVLVDGEFVLWDSAPIMRYLAERGGEAGLIPADLQTRALMEQWLAWQSTELAPTWLYAFLALARPTPGYDDAEKTAAAIAHWTARMQILEAQLSRGGPYVTGKALTLADMALALSVHRWFATPFERRPLAAVADYYALMKADPAGAPYLTAGTP